MPTSYKTWSVSSGLVPCCGQFISDISKLVAGQGLAERTRRRDGTFICLNWVRCGTLRPARTYAHTPGGGQDT